MTDRMSELRATDRLVSALAERRGIGADDRVAAALAALVEEIDARAIPVVDLPTTPSAVPFMRRAAVATGAVAVLAFSSSGIAAAVTGDPLLPVRYVVDVLHDQWHEDTPDPNRLFVGDAAGAHQAGTDAARYAAVERSRSSDRIPGSWGDQRSDDSGSTSLSRDLRAATPEAGDGLVAAPAEPAASPTEPVPPAPPPTAQAPDAGAGSGTATPAEPPAPASDESAPDQAGDQPAEEPPVILGETPAPTPHSDNANEDRAEHRHDGQDPPGSDAGEPHGGPPATPGGAGDGRPGTGGRPAGDVPVPPAEPGSRPDVQHPKGPPADSVGLPDVTQLEDGKGPADRRLTRP